MSRRIATLLCLLLFATAAPAWAQDDAPEPLPPVDEDALAEQPEEAVETARELVGHFEALGEIMAAHHGNCGQLADALGRYADENAKRMHALVDQLETMNPNTAAEIQQAFAARLAEIRQRIPSLRICAPNEDVTDAMTRMSSGAPERAETEGARESGETDDGLEAK